MTSRRVEVVETMRPITRGDDATLVFTLVLNESTADQLTGSVRCSIEDSEDPGVPLLEDLTLTILNGGTGRQASLTLSQAQTTMLHGPRSAVEAKTHYADILNIDQEGNETTYGPYALPVKRRITRPDG